MGGRIAAMVVTHPADVLGTRPIDRILANEPIRVERVARHIPPSGLRGVYVPMDDAILQWVEPGMHVDVMRSTTNSQGRVVGQVVAMGVEVLEVFDPPKASPDAPEMPAAVALAVSPRDAERITTAQPSGSLRLTIRSGVERPDERANVDYAQQGCLLYPR